MAGDVCMDDGRELYQKEKAETGERKKEGRWYIWVGSRGGEGRQGEKGADKRTGKERTGRGWKSAGGEGKRDVVAVESGGWVAAWPTTSEAHAILVWEIVPIFGRGRAGGNGPETAGAGDNGRRRGHEGRV